MATTFAKIASDDALRLFYMYVIGIGGFRGSKKLREAVKGGAVGAFRTRGRYDAVWRMRDAGWDFQGYMYVFGSVGCSEVYCVGEDILCAL